MMFQLRSRSMTYARYAMSLALFFIIWEAVGRYGDVFAITPASQALPMMVDDLVYGDLLAATLGTLTTAAIGLAIAIVVGIPLGLLTGGTRRGGWLLEPVLNGAYATPATILLPIIGLYLGLQLTAKVFVVFFFCVFVIAINTASGVRSVPQPLHELGAAFGMSKWRVATQIVLRGASPEIIMGLRLAVSRAVQGAVLADLLLQADDLGMYLIESASTFQISRLLGGIFFITLVATALMITAQAMESRLLHWKLNH